MPVLLWTLRSVRPRVRLASPVFVPRGSRPVDVAAQEVSDSHGVQLLFVHRDAEAIPWKSRRREIPTRKGVVAVVPVRMTEAWLLIDEAAIRSAAGNPNGQVRLGIPGISRLESVADPKGLLRSLLVTASEATGRRRERFERSSAVARLAEQIQDYSPLMRLPAFRAFEKELVEGLAGIGA